MLRSLVPALALFAFGTTSAVRADDLPYALLDPNGYQSFVGDWTPPDQPFCAALQSTSQWNEVMHPAATMGPDRPFGPPASFWATHSVVLVARTMPAGELRGAFKVTSVRLAKRGLEVAYSFARPPKSKAKAKWYMAVVVPSPLPERVRLIENRREVCRVEPGTWSPIMIPSG